MANIIQRNESADNAPLVSADDLVIRQTACPVCGKPFSEGRLLMRMAGDGKVYCHRCRPDDAPNGTYLFHDEACRRSFRADLIGRLADGVYGLDHVRLHLIIRPITDDHVPDFYLEQRGEDTMVVFRRAVPFDELEARLARDTVLMYCRPIARFAYADDSGLVQGIATADNVKFDLLKRGEMLGTEPIIIKERMKKRASLPMICTQTERALEKIDPAEMLAFFERRVQGQGIELRKAVHLLWQYLKAVADGEDVTNCNWFLTAPSGCGKTEFYRAARDLFKEKDIPVPVVQLDLMRYSDDGWKGRNISTIPETILSENKACKGYAICFLDEADKRMEPRYESKGGNVNASIQYNLLTMIEGTQECDTDGEKLDFDSGKTMFVLMGAFQSIRDERQKESMRDPLGFGTVQKKDSVETFYSNIEIEDIVKFGMVEELAGRMAQVINFHRLDDDAMRKLLRCKTEEIGKELHCEIRLSEKAEDELLEVAFGNLGLRHPMNLIRKAVQTAIADVFFTDGFDARKNVVLLEGRDKARIVPRTTGRRPVTTND